MSKKVNPTAIGVFVVGAVILLSAAILLVGTGSLWEKRHRFLIYFEGATNGLEIGSDVRIGGVRIGEVAQIRIQADPVTGKSVIPVVIELIEGSINQASAEPVDFSDPAWAEEALKEGLRAVIRTQSALTGKRYIEVDYMPEAESYLFQGEPIADYPQIPSVKGEMEALKSNLAQVVDNISGFDFKGISDKFKQLLVDIDEGVKALELKELGEELNTFATSARELVENPDLKEALANLESVTGKLDEDIKPITEGLKSSISNLDNALVSVEKAVANAAELVDPDEALAMRLNNAVSELSRAMRAVREFADYLKRNPNSLITGKKLTR